MMIKTHLDSTVHMLLNPIFHISGISRYTARHYRAQKMPINFFMQLMFFTMTVNYLATSGFFSTGNGGKRKYMYHICILNLSFSLQAPTKNTNANSVDQDLCHLFIVYTLFFSEYI
jgi:hypothetical protein